MLYVMINTELMIMILILAILVKSSLYLFSYWLPVAIERPTPVSSLLHSSTIVVAGVYLSMLFNMKVIVLMIVLLLSYSLYNQIDVKKNIALSTSLHLVIMLLIVIVGFYAGVVLYIILHRMAKRQLFQLAGYSLHTVRHQDLRMYSASMLTLLIILPMFLLTALVRIVIVTKEILLIDMSSLFFVLIILISI